MIILFIVLGLAVLIFHPPHFMERMEIWIVALSGVPTSISLFHAGIWFMEFMSQMGIVGAPMIQMGLVMVLIGSLMLLITSCLKLRMHNHLMHERKYVKSYSVQGRDVRRFLGNIPEARVYL